MYLYDKKQKHGADCNAASWCSLSPCMGTKNSIGCERALIAECRGELATPWAEGEGHWSLRTTQTDISSLSTGLCSCGFSRKRVEKFVGLSPCMHAPCLKQSVVHKENHVQALGNNVSASLPFLARASRQAMAGPTVPSVINGMDAETRHLTGKRRSHGRGALAREGARKYTKR